MPEFSFELLDARSLQNQFWNDLIAGLPNAHVLQTAEWSQVKTRFGWQRLPIVWRDSQGSVCAAAMALSRSLSISLLGGILKFIYIPKGPILDWTNSQLRQQILRDLRDISNGQRAVFLKIDPDVPVDSGESIVRQALADSIGDIVTGDLQDLGWVYSHEQIQFKNTVFIDLSLDEAELLGRMKQKTRYNLRLAARKGVKVRKGDISDIPTLYQLYLETSVRDHFVIREQGYYQEAWSKFLQTGLAVVLLAEVDGKPIAGLILFLFAEKAWFMYGMSSSADREKMPNYLLQWEAILDLKARGCRIYDLWGAPDEFHESDPLWGVYRFKEGLGGVTARHIGAWDLPLRKKTYYLYSRTLPVLLNWMRRRGNMQARRLLT